MTKKITGFLAILLLHLSALSQTVWYEIASPTNQKLRSIQFVSNQLGFIGGDSILLKTIDSGITWTPVEIESLPLNNTNGLDIYDLHFFDENHGYIMSGLYGALLETFDGGTTWTSSDVVNGFCVTTSMYFFNEEFGFAGGGGCFEGHIITRLNDGEWIRAQTPMDWANNYVTTINFKDELFGLAGTREGKLLRTTDGGLNWDTIPNPASGNAITDFTFGEQVIYASHSNVSQSSSQYGVIKSTDNGLSWEPDDETATFFYPGFNATHKDGNGTIFFGGDWPLNEEGLVFDNSEVGFWQTNIVSHPINDIDSHTDSITFLVGDQGTIHVNVNPDLISNSIYEIEETLFEMYPNPVSNVITVSGIDLEVERLEIIDITGKIVISELLFKQESITLEVGNIPFGTYTLKLTSKTNHQSQLFIKE